MVHIVENKCYGGEEFKDFDFISDNSKGTLSIVLKDGTHWNFRGEERKILIDFINKRLI